MTVGSLFAGIGGFDLGFERAGAQACWQVEQDGKAQSVLTLRFPNTELFDDVRTVGAHNLAPVDVICGGFPCQDVSVAGKREGLGGERTGLFWEVVRIARALRPRWMVLENVPGLLSSHGGRDFHTVLAALAECGFRREYRILDSRYFGVAQRRRRVFLVLRARDAGHRAAPVLFESTCGSGDSPASNEAGTDVAATLRGRSHGAGVNAPGRGGEDDANLIAFDWQTQGSERTRPHCGSEYTSTLEAGKRDALMIGGGSWPTVHSDESPTLTGRRADQSAIYQDSQYGVQGYPEAGTLRAGRIPEHQMVLGVHANQRGELRTSDLAGSLNGSRSGKQFEGIASPITASAGRHGHSSARGDGRDNLVAAIQASGPPGTRREDESGLIAATLKAYSGGNQIEADYLPQPMGVRRLTPLECERLQGFPDGWTCLCGRGYLGSSFCECADSPRYKQLGNAVTVNVAEWIARRILEAESLK